MAALDLVVTGAGGRLAQLLRRAWALSPPDGLRVLWAGRSPGFDLQWEIGTGPVPAWPRGARVLHLAGLTRGTEADLAHNVSMVPALLEGCRQNRAVGLMFASTAAVYAPSARPAQEETEVDPQNAYGRSKVAAEAAVMAAGLPVTRLRIGNVAGADALLGRDPAAGRITLDPVPGRKSGPVRSWIGPVTLARILAELAPQTLPPVLNIASDPPLAMADLLNAAGLDWAWGPPNPAVVPDAVLSVARLAGICDLPPTSAARIIAEITLLRPSPQT